MKGLGLAQVPRPIAEDQLKSGKLESVLDGLAPTIPGVFLYYPSRRQMLPKLRAFVDHLKARAADATRRRRQ